MSSAAVFSNELAVHMYLDQQQQLNDYNAADRNVNPRLLMRRAGTGDLSVKTNNSKSATFIVRAGSFSEVMNREKRDEDTRDPAFESLFPEKILDKDRTTYFRNPLAFDNDEEEQEEYVIREPSESVTPRPSTLARSKSTKFASILGLVGLNQRSESPPTPPYSADDVSRRSTTVGSRRSFSARFKLPPLSTPSRTSSGMEPASAPAVGGGLSMRDSIRRKLNRVQSADEGNNKRPISQKIVRMFTPGKKE